MITNRRRKRCLKLFIGAVSVILPATAPAQPQSSNTVPPDKRPAVVSKTTGERKCKYDEKAVMLIVMFSPTNAYAQDMIDEGPKTQRAAPENAPTWWVESMENLDERMQWWEESRFALFIHWGPYSVLGGEYKDRKLTGLYAEHIARFCKIPKEDYIRDAAGVFRPEKFNAEEWVLLAKNAGMKYLVITAKHHDGFAIYDSKHSDFDIKDTAKWDRDPLRELKEACDKHGLHFGVYYSHLQDWYEKYNIMNTWDFDHPSKADGGNWFMEDTPEIKEHLRNMETHYLDSKSIPQVKELINDYKVKMIWFDTPERFPAEFGLKVLKAARQANPDLVVNARVVRGGGYGDYRGSSDSPYAFPCYEERYWEAIQSVTRSWGYNKHNQHTRKSPEFLLKMLVTIVSKGGNFMLNIGPLGDGSLFGEDVKTLQYFADWSKDHADSIHGAKRNPIAPQNWGVVTTKDNNLYLHVFKWPKNGELTVGGLKNNVEETTLMAGNIKLKNEKIGDEIFSIKVPENPSHPIDSVIKVVCEGEPTGDGYRLLDLNEMNQIHVYDYPSYEGRVRPSGGKRENAVAQGFAGKDARVIWKVRVAEKNKFNVHVIYDAREGRKGTVREYQVVIGSQSVSGEVNMTRTGKREYKTS